MKVQATTLSCNFAATRPAQARTLAGLLSVIGAAALVLLCSTFGFAEKRVTLGPASDLLVNLPLDQLNGGLYNTTFTAHTGRFYNGFDRVFVSSHGIVEWNRVAGLAYVTAATNPKGDLKGLATVTTIYGHNLSPDGADPAISGYTPGAPEIGFESESMVGRSHKLYPASSSELIAIGDLSSRLGPDFDLSQFQGDPTTVVYLFQTIMPATDIGIPAKGLLLSEDFGNAYHVGYGDFGGAFGPGSLPATGLVVTEGDVDILGVANGSNGSCDANPNGNCLDLIGNTGIGAVQSLETFSLDPKYTYTIQFNVVAQSVNTDLDFTVSLGHFSKTVTATPTPTPVMLTYTPSLSEDAVFGLTSITNIDDQHGPVISSIALCAHKVGTKNLKCQKK